MTAPLDIDLLSTPFSRRGSYFAISQLVGAGGTGIHLRTVHGGVRQRELLRFVVDGDEAPDARTRPGLLSLQSGDAAVEIALEGSGRALVRVVRGTVALDLQVLSQYDVVLQERAHVWRYIASGANRNYRLASSGGDVRLEAGWDGVKDSSARLVITATDAPVLLVVDEFDSTLAEVPPVDFDATVRDAEADFTGWLDLHGPVTGASDRDRAVRLAAFVTWAALVPAGGMLRRESMLMSKNWMTNVWAWDHCFNAMALWRDPAAAADQLLTLFDHQDAHGALPDYVNDAGIEPNFVKPPIHGWAISYLMDRGGLSAATLVDLYTPLVRWTEWWFAHRVYGGDGIPSYNHGNDSGWDNSTVFAGGVPVQSPDLLAFLALQMAALARMADVLGHAGEGDTWRTRTRETVRVLIAEFWVDGRFVARHTVSREPIVSDSLLTLMPLALGDLLPADVFAALVRRLVTGGYLTARGPATEPPDSRHYVADGYWRGPVWAPTTMLLIDGLRRGGRADLADDIAQRFVRTCTTGGMAENFDAETGDGLRDLSMTWTASVFLALLQEATPERVSAAEITAEAAP